MEESECLLCNTVTHKRNYLKCIYCLVSMCGNCHKGHHCRELKKSIVVKQIKNELSGFINNNPLLSSKLELDLLNSVLSLLQLGK
jgi:hypothetical protein